MTIPRRQRDPLDVLIIGAGIAGLTAAIALGKQGHRVVILEKSRFARETGAAIYMPPNCTALLQWMGISPSEFGGTLLHRMQQYDHRGNVKNDRDFTPIRHEWQAEWYLVHRVDLHNHLKQKALETATLHLECKIVNIDIMSARPSVSLDDGRTFECDLLLGADGLLSVLRNKIAPSSPAPEPVGKSTLRWLLPVTQLKNMEATSEAVRNPGTFIEWAATDRRLVAYPCSDNQIFNLCGFLPTSEAGGLGEGWQASGNKQALIRGFSDFPPSVKALVENAGDDLKVWELYDMEPLPSWVKGHSALLGDAAHPFQPYMGQGGAMAIEDAVSLAILLPLGTSAKDIARRLALYEEARRERVETILEYTRINGRDDDASAKRISPEEMIRLIRMCFAHNEVQSSGALLQEAGGCEVSKL
ncbi:FAD/NAD(P)-binding domain-containing protein [Aspergillus steynii IBT 23096]|uniref:FAD/NAD(P)-binding domain-containing protein n=1 Tax=Aspergillus steynii IBT 23096 TaxID=1392250 RepID=A0A2I2GH80_9EURO|nr:FAD/NAD(P)-binding domain-containing protein [Aspergillus steynii IBT 23096]PLB52241.1 FAD/NAD(P)-binding domain-containing protein [Aspergillus steynii IBT 23096]